MKSMMTEDKNPPKILFEETELAISVETAEEGLWEGVTATDEEDGDITDKIQILSSSRLMSGGKRTVKYGVFDNANNLAVAERTVVYVDYVPPRIYLKKPLRYTMDELKSSASEVPAKAIDVFEGDISDKISLVIENEYIEQPGIYPIMFQVSSSAGDTCSVVCDLEIIDLSDPNEARKFYPELSEYIVYTKVNQGLDFRTYLKGIASGSECYVFGEASTPANITANKVAIDTNNVNYQTPGVYKVYYSYTTRGGVKATTILHVVVEE